MSRPVRKLGAWVLLLAVAGCAVAPKSSEVAIDSDEAAHANSQPDQGPLATDTNPSGAAAPSAASAAANGAESSSNSGTASMVKPPSEPTELLALVQSLRTLSPAEQDQLMQDLKQTDPKLWPLVTQQFKASLEYRKRQVAGAQTTPATTSADVAAAAPIAATAMTHSVDSVAGPKPDLTPALQPLPPSAAIVAAAPAAMTMPANPHPVATSAAAAQASTAAATAATAPSDWRQPLSATIASVEQSLRESPGNDDRQIHLRLLHLMAGHRDQALELVPGREPAEQEFWSKELYALSTLWDVSRQPDQGKRRTEAAIHFDEANAKLRELGLLTIRNLAFCTEVNSYGVYKRFENEEFGPEQRVLLYAELENFVSEATPQGYHTALKASYQIFDSRGTKIEEQQLPAMEEYCQNPRRDFFVAYSEVRMPKQIYDGRYTLKLTIEDTLGKKVAQSSIEFTVKSQPAALATR